MLSFTGGLKVFVALEPVDLRKRASAGWKAWSASASAKTCGRVRSLSSPTGGTAA
jgi:hypothetical protein